MKALALLLLVGTAHADNVRLTVEPAKVDAKITGGFAPHVVAFDSAQAHGKLLVFLPGTGGAPENRSHWKFLDLAVAQHYRVIALSYIDDRAVGAVCMRERDPGCALAVRERRVFGTHATNLIADEPADAIVARLRALLLHLQAADKSWNEYLVKGEPNWARIVVAGQSQGGGMAALIGKRLAVAGVIDFSGGWDTAGKKGTIAPWYSDASATPPERWWGSYHTEEEFAPQLAASYAALKIPKDHTFALDQPVDNGGKPHGQGIGNDKYKPMWLQMLGDGAK